MNIKISKLSTELKVMRAILSILILTGQLVLVPDFSSGFADPQDIKADTLDKPTVTVANDSNNPRTASADQQPQSLGPSSPITLPSDKAAKDDTSKSETQDKKVPPDCIPPFCDFDPIEVYRENLVRTETYRADLVITEIPEKRDPLDPGGRKFSARVDVSVRHPRHGGWTVPSAALIRSGFNFWNDDRSNLPAIWVTTLAKWEIKNYKVNFKDKSVTLNFINYPNDQSLIKRSITITGNRSGRGDDGSPFLVRFLARQLVHDPFPEKATVTDMEFGLSLPYHWRGGKAFNENYPPVFLPMQMQVKSPYTPLTANIYRESLVWYSPRAPASIIYDLINHKVLKRVVSQRSSDGYTVTMSQELKSGTSDDPTVPNLWGYGSNEMKIGRTRPDGTIEYAVIPGKNYSPPRDPATFIVSKYTTLKYLENNTLDYIEGEAAVSCAAGLEKCSSEGEGAADLVYQPFSVYFRLPYGAAPETPRSYTRVTGPFDWRLPSFILLTSDFSKAKKRKWMSGLGNLQ